MSFHYPLQTHLILICPTACVTRWWAGRGNATLTEPTPSHANGSKTRRLPPVGCTLCWASRSRTKYFNLTNYSWRNTFSASLLRKTKSQTKVTTLRLRWHIGSRHCFASDRRQVVGHLRLRRKITFLF